MKKAEIDEILMPGADEQQENETRVKRDFWNKLKSVAGRIPFMLDVVAAYYCAMDPQTPTKVRVILFAALAYFILPFDVVPDFLAGFGLTDDLAVLAYALHSVKDKIGEAHYKAAKAALEQTKDS